MNKGLHRTVFSKKHNTMVAVAETANSQGKGKQAGTSAPASPQISDGLYSKLKTTLKTLVCSLVSVSMVLPAHAQITADKNAPKNQQAVILKTNTGAPLVNIQTPNAKGLSHNRYTQFDVDNKGAVLNNDRHNNPFLAKGGARLILNEVRGAASHINGIVTVGGQKADVIIANPNGITVNGGGFKNVGRGILTTGTPQIGKDGALTGFDVRQGTVTVGQAGWNDQGGADYTEVLARAVALQGKLQGKNLAVSTGAQKTDYVSGEISAGTAAGTKPAVAIDTAALGGMYADSITLIANEKGVGVKNAGTLEAAKQLVVISSGRIENSGRMATTADSTEAAPTYLSIETTEKDAGGAFISNGGKIESKGLLVIDTGEDIGLRNGAAVRNNGSRPAATVLNAGRNLVIESKANVNNAKGSAHLSAGGRTVIKDAGIQAGADVYVSGKDGTELGHNTRMSGQNVTLLSNGSISSSAAIEAKDTAHIEAGKPLSLETSTASSDIRLNGGSIKGGKQLALLADDNITAKSSSLNAPGSLYVDAGKNLNLTIDNDLSAAAIHLKADHAADIGGAGKTLTAAKDIGVQAGSLNMNNIHLRANAGNLHLQAAKGDIRLRNTRLYAGQNVDAAAWQGNIVSDGLSAESARGRISLLAEGNTVLKGQHILKARTDVNLGSAGKGRLNAADAQIEAGGDVHMTSAGRLDYAGQIQGRNIRLESRKDGLALRNTHIQSSGSTTVAGRGFIELHDTALRSGGSSTVVSQSGNVHLGTVDAEAGGHFAASAGGGLYRNGGRIKAAGLASLEAVGNLEIHNGPVEGGAVYLAARRGYTGMSGVPLRAATSPQLQNDQRLKDTDGRIRSESRQDTIVAAGTQWQADKGIEAHAGGSLTFAGESGGQGNPSARVSTLNSGGHLTLTGADVQLQGTQAEAAGDVKLTATKGHVRIGAVRNTFDGYVSEERVAQLRTKLHELDQESASLQAKQAAWEQTPEHKNLESHFIDLLDYYEVDPSYSIPYEVIIDRNDLPIPDWQAHKAKIWPYREPIKALAVQKNTLEKNLSAIQNPGRGHEHKGSVISGAGVSVLSAGGVDIKGSRLSAGKRLDIQAAGSLPVPTAEAQQEGQLPSAVDIGGVFDTFEYGQNGSDRYAYAIFSRPSELSGREGIAVAAPQAGDNSRIVLNAADLSTDAGKISLSSYGDQLYTSGQGELFTFDKHSYKTGKWYNRKHVTEIKEHRNAKADPVNLTAAQGIDIKSGGSLHAYATRFDAPAGTVDIRAGRELKLFAVDEVNYDKLESHKKRKFLGITYDKVHDTSTRAMQTALPSRVVAESADLKSGWDTLLQGTEFETGLGGARIQAGVGEQARADAKIILEGIKSSVRTETVSNSKSALWQKQAGRGSMVETLKLPGFTGTTAPVLTAPGGYIADIPAGRLKDEIKKLAEQPRYAYLKQLQTAKNVDWKKVQLAYDKWDYKQEGLTGAGAAVVTIIVTALTYGYGAAAAGGTTAAGSGAGAATAATTTTTAAGATAAGTTVVGISAGTASAMGTAALAALNSRAAVALINNKGDIGKSLKELGKDDTVKAVITAAVTAGIADKLGAAAQWNNFNKTFTDKLTTNLATGTATGLANTAINGGSLKGSLENSILNALVQTGHMQVSAQIKGLDKHYLAHKIAHAVAGCAATAANKGSCSDGAIGAAVGEIVGEALVGGKNVSELSAAEKHRILSYSKIVAGSVAALNGGNVDAAANAAQVAVVNNALSFESTPTNAKKHQPQQPDKTALEKIIQSVAPSHAEGAMTNPQDKDAAIWISNIRNGITGPIVITSYGVYAAGWTAPLIGTAGKLAISTCMANPSGCTVMVTQAAEAGAGIATGAVTVGNAWEAPVGALSKAKAAKQAVSPQTANQLNNLVKNAVNESRTARAASNFRQYTALESRVGVANIFNSQSSNLKLGNMEIKEMANSANRVNTTRVFDSSKISDAQLRKEVFAYAEKLGGGQKPVATTNPNIWNIKTVDGATINVRSVSSTSLPDGSKPRWTIEILNDKKLDLLINESKLKREIKFK